MLIIRCVLPPLTLNVIIPIWQSRKLRLGGLGQLPKTPVLTHGRARIQSWLCSLPGHCPRLPPKGHLPRHFTCQRLPRDSLWTENTAQHWRQRDASTQWVNWETDTARRPPGGEFGRNGSNGGWGFAWGPGIKKSFWKTGYRDLEMKHGLPSKPWDLEVVFQIPIRNPIIKKDWKQVITSQAADSGDKVFSGCPAPANKEKNIPLSPDANQVTLPQARLPTTKKYICVPVLSQEITEVRYPPSHQSQKHRIGPQAKDSGMGAYVLMWLSQTYGVTYCPT